MFKRYQQVHFVGIGGVGMSGIAEVLLNLGYRITGSDARRGERVERLERLGAKVFIGHEPVPRRGRPRGRVLLRGRPRQRRGAGGAPARHPGDPARGDARRADAAQVRHRRRGHPRQDHDHVAGRRRCSAAGELDPTVVVGGRIHGLGANARLGQGEFLVAEADESDGSFLKLSPTIAVVTTVDAEHLDHYADLDAIRAAFLTFVNKVPFYGAAVLCLDEPNIQQMIPAVDKRVITYGLESSADLTARRLAFSGTTARFEVVQRGRVLGPAVAPDARPPQRAQRARRHRGGARPRDAASSASSPRARRLPRRAAPLPDPRGGPRRPRRRRLRPSSGRDPRHPRRRQGGVRPARDHGVPAAPLQPHAAPPAGVPHRLLPVGRAGGDGHLPGRGGAHSGSARARSRRGHRRARPPGGAVHGRRSRGDRRLPVRIHALRGPRADPRSR